MEPARGAYTYNNAGQLSEARLSGMLQASYLYNAQGQRTRKSTASGTTVYHYDLKGRLIGETRSDGTMLRAYVWTGEAPLAQIDRNLLGQETVVYLHADHQGTPRLATNSAGTVVWRWVGSAFGDVSPNEDPDNDGGLTVVNLRYEGQYFDSETGFHYNWNRYYDPRTGRYISSDPIGLAGGLNSYAYVNNNPLRFTDPSGLSTTFDTWCRQYPVACAAEYGPKPRPVPVPVPIPGDDTNVSKDEICPLASTKADGCWYRCSDGIYLGSIPSSSSSGSSDKSCPTESNCPKAIRKSQGTHVGGRDWLDGLKP